MVIGLCKTNSENNCIGKSITLVDEVSAVIKKECSIEMPILELYYDGNINNINYLHIPSLERYYFISDIDLISAHRYKIHCKVDVLQSFANAIKNLNVLVIGAESGIDYLNSDVWVKQVKDKTDIIKFPSGLLESGEYILITAGG